MSVASRDRRDYGRAGTGWSCVAIAAAASLLGGHSALAQTSGDDGRQVGRAQGAQRGNSAPPDAPAINPDVPALVEGAIPAWFALTSADLHDQGDYASALALSPDGRSLAVGGGAGMNRNDLDHGGVAIWDLATKVRKAAIVPDIAGNVASLAFHPGGKILAIGDDVGDVVVWDLAANAPAGAIRRPRPEVFAPPSESNRLRFDPDGRLLLIVGNDLRVWDVTSRRQAAPWAPPKGLTPCGVAVEPGGKLVAACLQSETEQGFGLEGAFPLTLRDIAAGPPRWTHVPKSGPKAIDLSDDGRRNAVLEGGGGGTDIGKDVVFLDAATGRPSALFRSRVPLRDIALSPNGRVLACLGDPDIPKGRKEKTRGGTLILLDAATAQPRNGIAGVPLDIGGDINFSRDGQLLAATDASGGVKVWRVDQLARSSATNP